MKLTDSIIKAAKPRDKRYNLPDGKGLTLWVQPDGQKNWRFRYYFQDKEKMLSLGSYPAVSLAAARKEHTRFKQLLIQGIDPSIIVKSRNERRPLMQPIALNQLPGFGGIIGSMTKPSDTQTTQYGDWKLMYFHF